MGPAVVGTVLTVGVAALIAIPLGLLGAIYLNEYGKTSPLARSIRTMADVMSGVPSVIMGLFIYLTFVVAYKDRTALAGALALACLMLPVVIRSSEEMLRLVPDELRQASQALGARKWRTTVTVVLPAAISGITSGALLAIARAAGETAPIVLVVGIATGKLGACSSRTPHCRHRSSATRLQPFDGRGNERAWGAALSVVIIVLITTSSAGLIANRFAIKER
jgi:phosphate transport system permease protein